jgi:hypothetical protein
MAERFIQTIVEKAQAIHLEACIPQNWWEFAVNYAVHVYNHTTLKCSSNDYKTLMSTPDTLPTEIALITLLLFKLQVYLTSLRHYYYRPITLFTFQLLHQSTLHHMVLINTLQLPIKKFFLSTRLVPYTHSTASHSLSYPEFNRNNFF